MRFKPLYITAFAAEIGTRENPVPPGQDIDDTHPDALETSAHSNPPGRTLKATTRPRTPSNCSSLQAYSGSFLPHLQAGHERPPTRSPWPSEVPGNSGKPSAWAL